MTMLINYELLQNDDIRPFIVPIFFEGADLF